MPRVQVKPDEIRIARFSSDRLGEKVIKGAEEIDRIVSLMAAGGEECADYVYSPQITSFRVEFFKNSELLARIAVSGDFLYRDGKWFCADNSSLEETLARATDDVRMEKLSCAFR